jgi:hypothetical protein
MLDRFEPMLKIICLALAALLLFQIVRCVVHSDPLGHASIPLLPTLAVPAEPKDAPTNAVAKEKAVETNAAAHPEAVAKQKAGETNTVAQPKSAGKETNAVARAKPPKHDRNFGPLMGGPMAAADLPPPIQTRIDRIKESEILGPFIKPMPLALLGIADDDAFLRAPNGQTGLIKEGGELGGIKVLHIGINRVLVEQNGEKKELTLFSGFGSDSLLPKETDTPTNATHANHKENP